MRIILFASLLLLSACYVAEAGIANIVITAVKGVLNDLIKKNQSLVTDANLVIPSDWEILGKGYLNLPNITLWGLTNTNTSQNLVYARDVDSSNVFVSIRLDISHMGLDIFYDTDMAILDLIPLYGTGDINIALSNVLLNVSLYLDYTGNVLNLDFLATDLDLDLTFHDSYSYISGFWNNPEADVLITDIINLVEKVIAMFYTYERQCFKCVLNPLLKYVVNTVLKKDPSLDIDCDCLQHLFDNRYNVEENVENLAKIYSTGTSKEFVNALLSTNMKGLYGEVYDKLKTFVEDEGMLDKYR